MTTASTIVFITGVGRGIGQALARAYLAQPNTTVIGSVRNKADPKYQDLKSSPAASGSKLILVTIESSSQTDPHQAVEEIKAAGIDHVDIAIANAGFSPPPAPLETIEIKAMEEAFRVNTLGPLILFQALKPLLDKSSAPKWLSVSTVVGSIANIEVHGLSALSAYGVSKAALNWITAGIHTADKNLIAFSIHPGLVQTEMGNKGARALGMEQAPVSLEDVTSKLLPFIAQATREKTSGKFFNLDDGTEVLY